MIPRTVFCLYPDIRRAPMMDSGGIDGRCGVRFITGNPIFEDGQLLEFETWKLAVEGARERGLSDLHVMKTIINVVLPRADNPPHEFSIGSGRDYEWPIR